VIHEYLEYLEYFALHSYCEIVSAPTTAILLTEHPGHEVASKKPFTNHAIVTLNILFCTTYKYSGPMINHKSCLCTRRENYVKIYAGN
jgi:hypothetical protein